MEFWKMVHYALDATGAAELDQRVRSAGLNRSESLLASFLNGRRATRASDQYWRDSRIIDSASTPLAHLGMDIGHRPGCDCRWCA